MAALGSVLSTWVSLPQRGDKSLVVAWEEVESETVRTRSPQDSRISRILSSWPTAKHLAAVHPPTFPDQISLWKGGDLKGHLCGFDRKDHC